jgi:UDP-N-acetylmuramoyl-tripeptide--D-alanyl-D-alanine ligase
MKLPLLGRHNVMNALAASTVAMQAGATLQEVKSGLERLKSVSGRLQLKQGVNGALVIDDTYNANPSSVAAGLDVLRGYDGDTVFVLGDMGELGDAALAIHKKVGELARHLGIRHLYGIGPLCRAAVSGFGEGAVHCQTREELSGILRKIMCDGMVVLVKGSRASQMEKVVEAICRDDKTEGNEQAES